MESSSDESLDDWELQHVQNIEEDAGNIIFGRYMDRFPFIAARCSLFLQPSRKKNVRDEEAKTLRRVLRKISSKQREGQVNGNDKSETVSTEKMKYHQLVANSILPKGIGISFIDAVLSRSLVSKQPSNGQHQQQRAIGQTVFEIVS